MEDCAKCGRDFGRLVPEKAYPLALLLANLDIENRALG
jgi:hypothetical protein